MKQCGDIDEGGKASQCKEVSFDSLSEEDKEEYARDNVVPRKIQKQLESEFNVDLFSEILQSPEALTGTVVEAHEPASSASSVDAEREEAGKFNL